MNACKNGHTNVVKCDISGDFQTLCKKATKFFPKQKHGKTHLLFFLFLWPAFCQLVFLGQKNLPYNSAVCPEESDNSLLRRRSRSEKAAPRRATFMEMILAHFHLTFQCLGFIYRSNGFVPKPYLLPSRTIVCYHIINHH